MHDGHADVGVVQGRVEPGKGRRGVGVGIHEHDESRRLAAAPGTSGGGCGREAVAQVAADDLEQVGQARRDATHAAGRGIGGSRLHVRQQIESAPLAATLGRHDEGQLHVVGGVQRGDLRDEGARGRDGQVAIPDERDLAAALQIDHRRQGRNDPRQAHEPVGRALHDRVERLHRVLLVGQPHRKRPHVGQPHPHAQEVGVSRATFPPPRGVSGQLDERLRVRMLPPHRRAVLGGTLGQPGTRGLEVVQVPLSLHPPLPSGVAPRGEGHRDAADEGDHEDDRAHDHHDRVVAQQHDHGDRRQAAHDGK